MLENAQAALPDLLDGAWITVQLTALTLAFGTVLGLCLALMRASGRYVLEWPALLYSLYFRGTPLLVQIFLIYYGSGQFRESLEAVGLWTYFRSPWFCGLLALSLNTAAYSSEIILGGIRAIPKGQLEAATAFALPWWPRFSKIVFPSVIRTAWPAYSNEVIFQLQATSLVSLITIMDITGVARRYAARTFAFFEIYVTSAVLYLILVGVLAVIFQFVERRLRRTEHAATPSVLAKGPVPRG